MVHIQAHSVFKISSSIPREAIRKNFRGSISARPVAGQPEEHAPHVLKQPGKTARRIRTFFIACGRDDFLFKGPKDLDATLTDLGIEHTFFASDGGHNMSNWRKYLYEYAQLLFRE